MFKKLFRGIHKVITWARPGLVGAIDFMSGGAITRQENRKEAIKEAKEDKIELEESLAKEWSQTERQAAIAAQSAELEADAAGEKSRASAIDAFKAESAALADSGQSGISEGSMYTAVQASVGEAERGVREWFTAYSQQTAMQGESTAMGMENARFSQKVGYKNLSRLEDDIAEMEEQDSGLNMALDFFGGFFSTVASVYSIGSTLGAGAKAAGMNLDWMGDKGVKNSFMSSMRGGAELKYAQLTEDTSYFSPAKPNNNPNNKNNGAPGNYGSQPESRNIFQKTADKLRGDSTSRYEPPEFSGDAYSPQSNGNVIFPDFSLSPLAGGARGQFPPIPGTLPKPKAPGAYQSQYGMNRMPRSSRSSRFMVPFGGQ